MIVNVHKHCLSKLNIYTNKIILNLFLYIYISCLVFFFVKNLYNAHFVLNMSFCIFSFVYTSIYFSLQNVRYMYACTRYSNE